MHTRALEMLFEKKILKFSNILEMFFESFLNFIFFRIYSAIFRIFFLI